MSERDDDEAQNFFVYFIRWKILQAVCTIPMAFIFFCWKIVPESPRWLISKGRVEEANSILEEICMVNKTDVRTQAHFASQTSYNSNSIEYNNKYVHTLGASRYAQATVRAVRRTH